MMGVRDTHFQVSTDERGLKLTWVDDRVLIVVVREVGVGIAAAPRKLQHHHAWGANGFSQHMDIWGDDS